MKTTKFFFAALAAIATLASCGPEENPGEKEEQKPVEEQKSAECKLTEFVVTAGTETINAFIDPVDKTVEITYFAYQFEALKAATAVATISEKATISPDPATAIDYTVEGGVEFTVTAEDGETKAVYKAFIALAEIKEACTMKWEKTFGELSNLGAKPNFDCGIGFCDIDKFAYADLQVFNLEGTKLGTLNVEGIPGLLVYGDGAVKATNQLAAVTNDVNGVLVAIISYEGKHADESMGIMTEVYGWLDGWDKKPTKIYGPVEYQCMYMSVAGDVKGDFVLNFRTGVSAPPQMHHVLVYKGGKYFKEDGSPACTWYGPMIPHPCNDGCWGQMLSFFSGNPEDGFVCWDSLAAAEYGESGNASAAFYVYDEGLTAFMAGSYDEVALTGNVHWGEPWGVEGRRFSYGNYSTGHVRAFIYNGQKYIAASSSSWPCNWITVQKANNLVEDDLDTDEVDESLVNYLMISDQIDGAGSCAPCSAYVLDPATRTGHIVVAAQSTKVRLYDITTEIL